MNVVLKRAGGAITIIQRSYVAGYIYISLYGIIVCTSIFLWAIIFLKYIF